MGMGNIEHRRNLMLAKQRSQTAYMNLWLIPAIKIVNMGAVLSILKFPVNPAVNQVVMVVGNVAEYHSFGPVFFQSVI